jgi:transcriptional regulator with XRE-family HTH domain
MDSSEIQQQLFQYIKKSLPDSASATEEIAKVLNVSVDSVYRRMRGEKTISLDELHRLCTHYKISLDSLMNIQTGMYRFEGKIIDSSSFRFDQYLTDMIRNTAYFLSFKEKEFYYLCKDIPIFYQFLFRDLAAFKYYFWMKTIFHFPDFKSRKFSFEEYPDDLFALGQKVLALYTQLPCAEFWNIENINSTIRQIEFYRDGQMFKSDKDVLRIYEALENLVNHLEMQASMGYKINYADPEKKPVSKYEMYYNEVLIGDNHMLVILDGVKVSLISHTTINYMMTRDLAFNENMYGHIQNLMQKSTLISSVSEKERSRFFRFLKERIQRRKDGLKV